MTRWHEFAHGLAIGALIAMVIFTVVDVAGIWGA